MLFECFYHDKLAHASYIVGRQNHGVAIVIIQDATLNNIWNLLESAD